MVGYEVNTKTGKPRGELVIEQIRTLSEKLTLTAQRDGAQIFTPSEQKRDVPPGHQGPRDRRDLVGSFQRGLSIASRRKGPLLTDSRLNRTCAWEC
jgi:hypothetical protein